MIIKSLSRKHASYGQLIEYISRKAAPDFEIRHNVPFDGDYEHLCAHFEDLADQLPKRTNGNKLYHEILSIPRREGLELERQQRALYALCQEYIKHRAPDHAVFGQMHLEGHHLHAHLIISPSSLDAPAKRVRIAKGKYNEIQKELEGWMMSTFPELEQAPVYTQDRPGRRRPEKEAQYEQRTGKASKKAQLRLVLERLLEQAETPEAFAALLKGCGLELYMRGDVPGIKAENRNYRLKTLGLAEQYTALTQRPTPEPAAAAPAPEPEPGAAGDRQPEPEPTPSAEEYSARRAQVAAERLAQLLRDLFAYSPDVRGLVDGLEHYGIRLEDRHTGVWCVHEGLEAPLESMGLQEAYRAAWQRLAPASAPEQPTPKTWREALEQERVEKTAHDTPEWPREAPASREGYQTPSQRQQSSQGQPEPSGGQMSERLRKLHEIRQAQREHPDLDLDGPGWGR